MEPLTLNQDKRTVVPLAEQNCAGVGSSRGTDDKGARSRGIPSRNVDSRGTCQRGGGESSGNDGGKFEEHCR